MKKEPFDIVSWIILPLFPVLLTIALLTEPHTVAFVDGYVYKCSRLELWMGNCNVPPRR